MVMHWFRKPAGESPYRFEPCTLRQLGNEVIGPDFVEDPRWLCHRDSPVFDPEGLKPEWATRARQPCLPAGRRFSGKFSAIGGSASGMTSCFESSKTKSGLFFSELKEFATKEKLEIVPLL